LIAPLPREQSNRAAQTSGGGLPQRKTATFSQIGEVHLWRFYSNPKIFATAYLALCGQQQKFEQRPKRPPELTGSFPEQDNLIIG
jgi:hypothetical protein